MKKQSLALLVLPLLVLQVFAEDATTYDLANQAQLQLDNLRSIVFGNIQTAQNTFAHYYSDMMAYSHNVISLGDLSIEQEYTTVTAEINQVKDLAHSANKDISSCTDTREQLIGTLKVDFINKLETCVGDENSQTVNALDSSFYVVDSTMTQVNNLQNQLNRCGSSLLCISPLLTEIELDFIAIPQKINLQVINTGNLLNNIKLLVGSCRDDNVSAYAAEASALLADVVTCANAILD